MRLRAGWWVVALPVLAACPDRGGELREATERRRLEQATLDSVRDSASTTGGRLPAFTGDSPASAAAAPDTQPAAPVTGQWTAGVLDLRREGPPAIVRGVRVARNDGFDRMVIDLGDGPIPGWHVEYVDRPVVRCGSGEPTELAGDGWLLVRLRTAQAHDDDGRPTVARREAGFDLPVVREMEMTCDFEGDVEVVLGVATPNPYRVTELRGPSRLVVDVQH
ncbi:MAG TPA: hypothetical protein VEW03_15690 [Longimicrobiaceae bacterium]|nr:hypothetical protein [Longimicrobiaceae bacterium]